MKIEPLILIRAGICFLLILVSTAILFVPTAEGADEVKAMFVFLTGLAVRDFFSAVSKEKQIAELKQAYDPTPQYEPLARED